MPGWKRLAVAVAETFQEFEIVRIGIVEYEGARASGDAFQCIRDHIGDKDRFRAVPAEVRDAIEMTNATHGV